MASALPAGKIKSQGFCRKLLYIPFTGGTLERKRNPKHNMKSLNEQSKRLQHNGWERFEEKGKRLFRHQRKPGRHYHCEMVWQSCEPALFLCLRKEFTFFIYYLHFQVQIPKMVHVYLVAHCYSGNNLYRRPEEIKAQAETHAPVKVSGCSWHLSQPSKGQSHLSSWVTGEFIFRSSLVTKGWPVRAASHAWFGGVSYWILLILIRPQRGFLSLAGIEQLTFWLSSKC